MRHVQHAADFGVIIKGEISFDWDKVIERSRGVAEKLAERRRAPVQEVRRHPDHGHGDAHRARQDRGRDRRRQAGTTLETPRTIIATGARAKFLPGIEADGDRVITYREAMVLPEVPKSVVVIGAGAIGIEFADFWNAFGVEVTVIECMPRICRSRTRRSRRR